MNMNEQMKELEESILHTYNRFVAFEKGQGCYLYGIPKERNIWILQQVLL